jgi:ribosome biogenesis GTPase / thiamine phosphate phosphatase
MTDEAEPQAVSVSLEDLGYGEFFQASLERDAPGLEPGRIVGQHRRQWDIAHAGGVERAVLAGRRFFARSGQKQDEIQPAIGDWVAWRRPGPGQLPVIEQVLERRTFLARTSNKLRGQRQIIVANVDVVAVVAAFTPPDASLAAQQRSLHPRRIERFLTAIRPGGARALVILNKADLAPDAEAQADQLSERLGTKALALSALTDDGAQALLDQLARGETIQSGVGKSSLVNRMLGHEAHRIGSLREEDARGRHTTTHRSLLLGPGQVLVIDTPGLRELSISEGRLEDLAAFEDVEALASECRFRDCTHKDEPGCNVRHAVETGQLSADRLRSYVTLADEVKSTGAANPEARPFARTKEAKRKIPKRDRREAPDD